MMSDPVCAIAARNPAVVFTVTVAPPAPPEVPFWPSALTLAKPLACPGCGGVGEVLGVGEIDGDGDAEGDAEADAEGETDGLMVGPGPGVSVTTTSSNDALEK